MGLGRNLNDDAKGTGYASSLLRKSADGGLAIGASLHADCVSTEETTSRCLIEPWAVVFRMGCERHS
jgi:hypothetical protein